MILAYILATVALLLIAGAVAAVAVLLRKFVIPALWTIAERSGNILDNDDVNRRITSLSEDIESMRRKLQSELNEIDEKVEHRYRKLTARQRREPAAEPAAPDDSPEAAIELQLADTLGISPLRRTGRRQFRRR